MGLEEKAVVDQLKEAGKKLSQPPTSNDELLNLIGNLGAILKKVDQCPSLSVQEALVPIMKALISDSLFKNSDSDIKTMVAVCFNEITRITAPNAPYDDNIMKQVIELIVASFDNLPLLSGRSYDEAVSILHNVAKVKSCVMMLDLDCENLIMKMFEQFLGNLSSDHPHIVFSAMETIMTVIIDESEDISLELLKVLLDSARKENEASSMSWKLGTKVIANTAQKLRPYVRKAMASGQINKNDYASLIDSICHSGSEALDVNHNGDSAENMIKPLINSNSQVVTEPEKEAKSASTKRGTKPNISVCDRNKVCYNKFPASPRGCPRKNCCVGKPTTLVVKSPAQKSVDTEKESEIHSGIVEKIQPIVSEELNQGTKRVGWPTKNATEGSGNMSVENSDQKDKKGVNGSPNKVTQTRVSGEQVFETPCGRKTCADIVGLRIKVWWAMDKMFYEGRIASYCPSTMRHQVVYDDGDVESLYLSKEKFELMGPDSSSGSRQTVPAKKEQKRKKRKYRQGLFYHSGDLKLNRSNANAAVYYSQQKGESPREQPLSNS